MDKCCFKDCRRPSTGRHHGKEVCDEHADALLSENPKIAAKARRQINLPDPICVKGTSIPITASGRRCRVCGQLAVFLVNDEYTVCSQHIMTPVKALVELAEPVATVTVTRAATAPAPTKTVPAPMPEPEPMREPEPVAEELPETSSEEAAEGDDWEARFANGEFD